MNAEGATTLHKRKGEEYASAEASEIQRLLKALEQIRGFDWEGHDNPRLIIEKLQDMAARAIAAGRVCCEGKRPAGLGPEELEPARVTMMPARRTVGSYQARNGNVQHVNSQCSTPKSEPSALEH